MVGAFVGERKGFDRPVAVALPGSLGHVFGFVTRDDYGDRPGETIGDWRLAVAEQLFILSDASVKVLVLEGAFTDVLSALAQRSPDTALMASTWSEPIS